jgi:hypothetical protein
MKANGYPVLSVILAVFAATGMLSAAHAAEVGGGEADAPRFAPGELLAEGYDNGLRGVAIRAGDDYAHGCVNEESKVIVTPAKDGPYIGYANGFALINEGPRDAYGMFIPEEAACVALNADGERVRSFDDFITWYDGKHGVAAISTAERGAPQALLYALTDESGKPVTAFEFDNITHLAESSRDVFWASKDGLWGCIRADGSVKLPFAYRQFRFGVSREGRSSSHVNIGNNRAEGIATYDGDIVIPPEYPFVGTFFDDPLVPVRNEEGKCAYFNTAGENVTGFVYDDAGSFSEGLARVHMGENGEFFGFIDTEFRMRIPPVYTGLTEGGGTPGRLYLSIDGVEQILEHPLINSRPIDIYVNDAWIYTANEAFIENGRTLAPLRRIAEALGYKVQWFPDGREIVLADEARSIRMTVGDTRAVVNLFDDGVPPETALLDVPPRIVDGRTYVPLRFIAEACGARVDYSDGETSVIRVTSAIAGFENPAPANINGGSTGAFSRRQLRFIGYTSIEADVTLPYVTIGEKGDCPYVYFGFDLIGDKGNAEGGFQYVEDESRADFGKWTAFMRQGEEWRWGDDIVLEPGSAHHLRFRVGADEDGAAELILELDGREVIRKPSTVADLSAASAKYVIAMAMSKPFDGENCLSRLENAKVENVKADGFDFDTRPPYREWRADIGDGVLFGSADCVASYIHRAPDGSVSIWKGE